MRVTRDDERARRICSLALAFMNASAPLPSSAVARDFYPNLSTDSFRRAFSRDRTVLAACGINVVELPQGDRESLWSTDEASSFAQGPELSSAEAAALEVACRPLVDDSTFPLADDLRYALAKLSRTFSETLMVASAPHSAASRALQTIQSCMASRTAVQAVYVNARDERAERTLAPYAFFSLRGSLYLVAASVTADAPDAAPGSIKTYRVDRFEDAKPLKDRHFSVPEDFCVEDWKHLPFQMGEPITTARFHVPADRERDVRRAAGAQGTFSFQGDQLIWSVPVHDIPAAARWAIAMGINPLDPEPLVAAWNDTLEEVLHRGR